MVKAIEQVDVIETDKMEEEAKKRKATSCEKKGKE